MLANRLVLAMALMLVAVACSSGGTRRATPANANSTTTATAVVTNLPKCPSKYPAASPAVFNAGTHGLDEMLVPIAALNVRVCRYIRGSLFGIATLGHRAASQLERETNRLKKVAAPLQGPQSRCGLDSPGSTAASYFRLTFASNTRQVTIINEARCDLVDGGDVTNGVRYSQASGKWLDDLQRYAPVRPPALIGNE
jgi:hypothetical protein